MDSMTNRKAFRDRGIRGGTKNALGRPGGARGREGRKSASDEFLSKSGKMRGGTRLSNSSLRIGLAARKGEKKNVPTVPSFN